MENPRLEEAFLKGIILDLTELTIHFVNSSGLNIIFVLDDENEFYHLFFYLCCNQQLRLYKDKMGPRQNTTNPLKAVAAFFQRSEEYKEPFNRIFLKQEFNSYAFDIPTEMKKVTKEREGFNSNCKTGAFGTKCGVTLKAWKSESKTKSYVALSLAQSFISRKNKQDFIEIIVPSGDSSLSTNVKDDIYRTVWGVGPSGCGKSFMTSQITPVIDVDTVLAIDGGNFRQCSNVWMVATTDHTYNHNVKDLYDAFKGVADVKKKFDSLFKSVQCSLYIPDTLVSAHLKNPLSGLGSYLTTFNERQISNNFSGTELPYVGTCIMQHCKTCTHTRGCTFPPDFQCKGCDISGIERAVVEGKSYSKDTYDRALSIGYETMFIDPRVKSSLPIFIHNSGQRDSKSVLVILTDKKYDDIADKLSRSIFKVIRIDSFPHQYNKFEDLVLQKLGSLGISDAKAQNPESDRDHSFSEVNGPYDEEILESHSVEFPSRQTYRNPRDSSRQKLPHFSFRRNVLRNRRPIKLRTRRVFANTPTKRNVTPTDRSLSLRPTENTPNLQALSSLQESEEDQEEDSMLSVKGATSVRQSIDSPVNSEFKGKTSPTLEEENMIFGRLLQDTKILLDDLESRLNSLRPPIQEKKTKGFFWGGRSNKRRRKHTHKLKGGFEKDSTEVERYKDLVNVQRKQLGVLKSIFDAYPNIEADVSKDPEKYPTIPIDMLTKFLKGFKEVSEFLTLQISMLEAKEKTDSDEKNTPDRVFSPTTLNRYRF